MSEVSQSSGAAASPAVILQFPRPAEQASKEPSAPGRTDTVETTSLARRLAEASAHVKEARGERTERVAALKAQIEAGTYKPDPDAIASALIDRAL